MDRPNVVLIHCHDLGRHLGCYGRGVETPHVDAIAGEGLRFDECYCTAPQCSPSRASMHTGMYPHEVGMLGLHNRGWRLDEGVRLLPEYFADAGYGTRLYGFQHVVDRTDAGMARSGYGEWDTATTRAREVADRFAADLDGSAEPFLATLGFTEPHLPYDRDYVDEEWYDRYDPDDVEPLPYLPDVEAVRRDLADCYGLLSGTVDRAVGRVDAALHGAGIADETLVVFTADHGIALPRAKGSLADPGIEIPLIARGPGVDSGTEDALLSNVDLLPTLLDYVDAPVPDVRGRSFAPLLTGDGCFEPREAVHAELTYHRDYHPTRAIRTADRKYVRNFSHGPRVHVPSDVFRTRAGRAVREEIYTTDRPAEELYDLADDPHERENLASGEQLTEPQRIAKADDPGAVRECREALSGWMARTDDPLLDGPVAPPSHERPPFSW
jgi:arylsulfatase A-like enzyme